MTCIQNLFVLFQVKTINKSVMLIKARKFFVVLFLAVALATSAQTTMRELWLSMPDSLLPTLNQNLRTEHVDFMDMNVPSEVKNLLGGEGRMDTLTARFTSVRVNESHTLQMQLLDCLDSTQIVMKVDTYLAPEPESTIRFFTTDWHPINNRFGVPDFLDAHEALDCFFENIDTLSQTEIAELKKLIDPVLVSISLQPEQENVILQLSMPFLLKDEKQRLQAVLKQMKLKWNGIMFKECE